MTLQILDFEESPLFLQSSSLFENRIRRQAQPNASAIQPVRSSARKLPTMDACSNTSQRHGSVSLARGSGGVATRKSVAGAPFCRAQSEPVLRTPTRPQATVGFDQPLASLQPDLTFSHAKARLAAIRHVKRRLPTRQSREQLLASQRATEPQPEAAEQHARPTPKGILKPSVSSILVRPDGTESTDSLGPVRFQKLRRTPTPKRRRRRSPSLKELKRQKRSGTEAPVYDNWEATGCTSTSPPASPEPAFEAAALYDNCGCQAAGGRPVATGTTTPASVVVPTILVHAVQPVYDNQQQPDQPDKTAEAPEHPAAGVEDCYDAPQDAITVRSTIYDEPQRSPRSDWRHARHARMKANIRRQAEKQRATAVPAAQRLRVPPAVVPRVPPRPSRHGGLPGRTRHTQGAKGSGKDGTYDNKHCIKYGQVDESKLKSLRILSDGEEASETAPPPARPRLSTLWTAEEQRPKPTTTTTTPTTTAALAAYTVIVAEEDIESIASDSFSYPGAEGGLFPATSALAVAAENSRSGDEPTVSLGARYDIRVVEEEIYEAGAMTTITEWPPAVLRRNTAVEKPRATDSRPSSSSRVSYFSDQTHVQEFVIP